MPPLLSLLIPTMRVGGISHLFDSLAAQEFTDFELILVDALFSRRADLVKQAAWERFLRVVHVEPNPNIFPVANYSATMNAGLAHATGKVVVLMTDYSRLPPDLLRKHAEFHKRTDANAGMMGPHRYRRLVNFPHAWPLYHQDDADVYAADVNSGSLDAFMMDLGDSSDEPAEPWRVDAGNMATWDADPKLRLPAGPVGSINLHCKNESVKLSKIMETGGFAESLDYSHGFQDSDMAGRLDKVGVHWTLDPSCVVDIVNPRSVFPFAKRLRPFRDNERIYLENKAAGFPITNERTVQQRRLELNVTGYAKTKAIVDEHFPGVRGAVIDPQSTDLPSSSLFVKDYFVREQVGDTYTMKKKPLRVGLIYGEFSTGFRAEGFDVAGLYTRQGLTGSESSFFNLVRTLSERGHEVVAFVKCAEEHQHESGATIVPLERIVNLPKLQGLDAVVAWNEPNYLQFAPAGVRRFCDQQLNDFGYCGPGWYQGARSFLGSVGKWTDWKSLVDVWVSPSQHHADHVMRNDGLMARVIPNSVDLELFGYEDGVGQIYDGPVRNPHRAIYCSSPDRGLHHLLTIWPLVRQRVPDAQLKVFYRLAPWLAGARDNPDLVGRRARYIEEAMPRLARMGVEVVDLVPNERMARELQAAQLLAYPCDPANHYTEGFACSVLDATAAGCLPVISQADALPSVHGKASAVVHGPVADVYPAWVDAICTIMETKERPAEWDLNMRKHAESHSRERVTDEWEKAFRGE